MSEIEATSNTAATVISVRFMCSGAATAYYPLTIASLL